MQHLSTAILIISLVIIVNQGSGVAAQDDELAIESQNRAITILSPKYVEPPKPSNQSLTKPDLITHKPEQQPPSKPPNITDKPAIQKHYEAPPRRHRAEIPPPPPPTPPRHYPVPLKLHYSPNSIYSYPRTYPRPQYRRTYYIKNSNPRPIIYSTPPGNPPIPLYHHKHPPPPPPSLSPKFSLPSPQVINGIRTEVVRPPKNYYNKTSTTTTTTAATTITTTQRLLRTKRIWPKRYATTHNMTLTKDNTTKTATTNETDRDTSESQRVRYVTRNTSSTAGPSTTPVYRPVTRKVKVKNTSPLPPINFTKIEPNDWVPILPPFPRSKRPSAHVIHKRSVGSTDVPSINKRSDVFPVPPSAPFDKQTMYMHSFGLVPIGEQNHDEPEPAEDRKHVIIVHPQRPLKPFSSGYSGRRVRPPMRMHYTHGDLETEGSHHHHHHSDPHVVTKIKHHHHHHHHRYIKTVEKPVKVPFKVEVPKPYPVQVEKKVPVPVEKIKVVEKKVPYPVTVEKNVPYPIGIKIPHPVPVKVVEKEYVPKPYPVVQQVPVVKHVEVKVPQPVPYPVEKKVPYPVEVKVPVPVDRPVPVPVHVEKKVPYPVPVRVLVPQPYPVEKKVPYPVEVKVKEPVEIVRHVPIKVPYPQPYAVKVPHPVPIRVEKRVPYPVQVEKKVPVPYEVIVPQRIEIEKKVPIYVPKPYPVEKKVPYPVKVPYPIRIPVRIPVKVPVYVPHPVQVQLYSEDHYSPSTQTYEELDDYSSSTPHTVTVHGNTGYHGFQSRSDTDEPSTTTIATTQASS